jgi:hypothetical protein
MMVGSWKHSLLWAVLAVAVPALAVADTSDDELRTNRQLLSKWRGDPEHYSRLKRDYQALQKLPPEKREQLRALDRDLHDEDADTQTRLGRVLDRYTYWLDHLPETDRARVEAAEIGVERLRIVKDLHEKEWIAHLARADQEHLRSVPADKRLGLIAELRQEERTRRREWQFAALHMEDPDSRSGKPASFNELPPDSKLYVSKTLVPMLRWVEKTRLRDASGKWPDYARTIYELSQEHASVKIPPGVWQGPINPMSFAKDDLPPELKSLMDASFVDPKKLREFKDREFRERGLEKSDLKHIRLLRETREKWPDFAFAVNEIVNAKKLSLKKPLGPCKLEDFDKLVQQFYGNRMAQGAQRLSPEEIASLEKARGTWPQYPLLFMELARKHKLSVPGTYLGGPPEIWKAAHEG